MSGELTSFQTLAGTAAVSQNAGRGTFRNIGAVDSQLGHGNIPRCGRGRGACGGRGGSFRGGRGGAYCGGHLGGRSTHGFQPYTGQTHPEAKCYPSHVWKEMPNNKKVIVNHLKQQSGWP